MLLQLDNFGTIDILFGGVQEGAQAVFEFKSYTIDLDAVEFVFEA